MRVQIVLGLSSYSRQDYENEGKFQQDNRIENPDWGTSLKTT